MKRLLPILLLTAAAPSFAAECTVTAFSEIKQDSENRLVQIAKLSEDETSTQEVTYAATTATTNAFGANMDKKVHGIRIICDAKAFFSIGVSPTATTSSPWIPADTIEYIGVEDSDKIAFCDDDCTA